MHPSRIICVESRARAAAIRRVVGPSWAVYDIPSVRELVREVGDVGIDLHDNCLTLHWRHVELESSNPLHDIADRLATADVVLAAGEDGCDGEAHAWHVSERFARPVRRVPLRSMEPTEIIRALAAPRSIDQRLVGAHLLRRVLDRAVGCCVSPLVRHLIPDGSSVSAGRVQIALLSMLADRHQHRGVFNSAMRASEPARITTGVIQWQGAAHVARQVSGTARPSAQPVRLVSSRRRTLSIAAPSAPTTADVHAWAAVHLAMTTEQTDAMLRDLAHTGDIAFPLSHRPRLSPSAYHVLAHWLQPWATHQRIALSPLIAHDGDALYPMQPSRLPRAASPLYQRIWWTALASLLPAGSDAIDTLTFTNSTSDRWEIEWRSCVSNGWRQLADMAPPPIGIHIPHRAPTPTPSDALGRLDPYVPHYKRPYAPRRWTATALSRHAEHRGIGRAIAMERAVTGLIGRGYVTESDRCLELTPLGLRVVDAVRTIAPQLLSPDWTADVQRLTKAIDSVDGPTWETPAGRLLADVDAWVSKAQADLAARSSPSLWLCPSCSNRMLRLASRFGPFLACDRCGAKRRSDGTPIRQPRSTSHLAMVP